ncbi:M23 family metallopeptidase [Caldicellulosiruptor acetigenus]|uniref:M23 family metallopeptidase n=1 Tax=Caldicellulosiruptor acetigenus TaxID=301953 RepID=UPI0003FA0B0C|nr:M23 family metallopeptidase [Caldicellulosiruptor acetigenus]WAM35838.1 M23 family metallopeptidase [Caldicellulosiruptor acetigenus]
MKSSVLTSNNLNLTLKNNSYLQNLSAQKSAAEQVSKSYFSPSKQNTAQNNSKISPAYVYEKGSSANEFYGKIVYAKPSSNYTLQSSKSGSSIQNQNNSSKILNSSSPVGKTKTSETKKSDPSKEFWEQRIEKWIFPLESKKLIIANPATDKRQFGAERKDSNGKPRAHAGVDLLTGYYDDNKKKYVGVKDAKVLAMTDGTVTAVYDFYAGTQAIEIKNSDGSVIRYGEVESKVKVGDKVKQGQVIATIIPNTKTHEAMLHLEVYKGDSSGPLTQRNNKTYKYVPEANYERRSDLINPMDVLRLNTKSGKDVKK